MVGQGQEVGFGGLPHLGHIRDIQPVCRANDVQEVVIGAEVVAEKELSQMIMSCLGLGCRVTNQPTFHERVFGEVPVDHITADWFLFADLAKRAGLGGIQEWLSFYFKSPQHASSVYPEHDLFIQQTKLKNTLRWMMGSEQITHLGMEYYHEDTA